MNHLIISREFPPSPYSAGGIGSYLRNITELLALHGETVHVIGQRWPGAPRALERRFGGRLIIHRVTNDRPSAPGLAASSKELQILNVVRHSVLPYTGFLWHAALLAESIIDGGGIDIVEAHDYEAPAFFLLLRRLHGLGPPRPVPIIVHLHTPTEFVFEANGWATEGPGLARLFAVERFVVGAADGLICPSRFLAEIAESRYQLESGAVDVVPYPIGDTPLLDRKACTWRDGMICYAGRLEPRKGVREWIEAATAVAEDISCEFAMVGGDSSSSGEGKDSMRAILRASIPVALRSRFGFCDALPRRQLWERLRRARIAVVPSRWENFPYACIEAMATGLPVLVSPVGGMVEMVEDGRTGWIADGADARSLEIALRRALATPPALLAEMGAAAGVAIRALCDNGDIVRFQLDLRRRVVDRGLKLSADVESCSALMKLLCAAGEAPSTFVVPLQGQTMTAIEIRRAPLRQQLAIVRRAVADPRYVMQWLTWHARRAISGGWSRLKAGRPLNNPR
jgi:glycosyltransferase involved in cell wall biosynthesis